MLRRSDLGLFRDLQRVVDLYAEISYRAFELRVSQEKLNGCEVLCTSIDQRRLGSTHRMRPVRRRIETDFPTHTCP